LRRDKVFVKLLKLLHGTHCNVEIDFRVPARRRHMFLQYVGNFLLETVSHRIVYHYHID